MLFRASSSHTHTHDVGRSLGPAQQVPYSLGGIWRQLDSSSGGGNLLLLLAKGEEMCPVKVVSIQCGMDY